MEESFHNLQLVPQNHDKWCTSDVLSKFKAQSDSVFVNMQLWVNELSCLLHSTSTVHLPDAFINSRQTKGLFTDMFSGVALLSVCEAKMSIDFHQKRNLKPKGLLVISIHLSASI